MASIKEPTFKINPSFRLTTKHLSVAWHCVDKLTIECESKLPMPNRFVFYVNGSVELLAQFMTASWIWSIMMPQILNPIRYKNGFENFCVIQYSESQKSFSRKE